MSTIKIIAIDQDGTLLNDDGSVSERNVQAVQTAVAQGIQVIIATGKTYASAVPVMARLGIKAPGVFTQGLVICNADGSVRYERALDRETAVQLIQFAESHNLPQTAYCGTRILAPWPSAYQRILHEKYGEPPLEVVGPLLSIIDDIHINKFLISDEVNNDETRRQLTALVGDRATVTQAVPEYIEVLPPGASKGRGVHMLLDDLGIQPEELLAIGDGENDLEMLQLAGVGVAMGNGKTAVKAIADYVTSDNNHSGVAEAIEKFAL
jgi:Cof subfamily protein (haloacid dehalogenase superfamily)